MGIIRSCQAAAVRLDILHPCLDNQVLYSRHASLKFNHFSWCLPRLRSTISTPKMFAGGTQEGKGDHHRLDGKTKPTQLCILNPRSHKSRRDGVYADYCRTATSGKSTTACLLFLQPRCGWMRQHGPVILDSCVPTRHKHPQYTRTHRASDGRGSGSSDEIRRHPVAKIHHHSFQTPPDTTFKFLSNTHYRRS